MIYPEFKRDLNHSYLVLPDKSYQINQDYQWDMVVANKISEFLPCSKQFKNGIASYCYDISSKQCVKRAYENREMEYEDVKNILLSIYYVFTKMKEYLLDGNCLVLDPEYLFMNIESKEIQFVFYPITSQNVIEGFKVLSEFFLSRVNHKDERAVEVIYHLFKEVRDDNFTLQTIITSMEKIEFHDLVSRTEVTKEKNECNIDFIQDFDSKELVYEDFESIEENDIFLEQRNIDKKRKFPIGLCIIIALGVLGCIFLLSTSKASTSPVLLYGFLIMIFTGIILYIINYIQDIKYQNDIDIIENEKIQEILHNDYRDIDNINNNINKNNNVKENSTDSTHSRYSNGSMDRRETFGNTELFGIEESKNEGINMKFLKGIINGEKISYPLVEFPISVGKMKDCVDIVIEDSSISRIHARFYEAEERHLLTDMNSTNGTFKNGIRLEPNETVEIEEGDEIKFAKFIFTYC